MENLHQVPEDKVRPCRAGFPEIVPSAGVDPPVAVVHFFFKDTSCLCEFGISPCQFPDSGKLSRIQPEIRLPGQSVGLLQGH